MEHLTCQGEEPAKEKNEQFEGLIQFIPGQEMNQVRHQRITESLNNEALNVLKKKWDAKGIV